MNTLMALTREFAPFCVGFLAGFLVAGFLSLIPLPQRRQRLSDSQRAARDRVRENAKRSL